MLAQQTGKQTIYDFGSNNGDDIPYYLMKADVVVAVEANPWLASQIVQRFQSEITAGRLFVENCVITTGDGSNNVPFYVHKHNHVLSQFPRPSEQDLADFEEVLLPGRPVLDLIQQYGNPAYIKVDLEGYDRFVLQSLFANNIRPPFISAESHCVDIFCLLVREGGYESFNLVDGPTVSQKYKSCAINSGIGIETYSFPHHSAGPFGDDIDGPWMTPDDFLRLLVREGFGWKDIHATTVIAPEPNVGVPAPHRLIASDPLVAASAHVELGLPLPRGTRFRLLNRLLARLTWLTTRHQYVFNRAVIEAIELQRRDVDIRLAELAVLFARVTKLESVSKVGMRAAAEQLPSE